MTIDSTMKLVWQRTDFGGYAVQLRDLRLGVVVRKDNSWAVYSLGGGDLRSSAGATTLRKSQDEALAALCSVLREKRRVLESALDDVGDLLANT